MQEKNKQLVIVGEGETALIAYEYFTHDSPYEVIAFTVEKNFIKKDSIYELPVLPFEDIENHYSPEQFEMFVAISSTQLNRLRTRLYRLAKQKGYKLASYISTSSFVWRNVEIGENCFIFENNTIQPFVKIGNNVVIWSGNHIGHNSIIKDNCFISSHVVISGFCEIGENCFLGVNSTIINNIKIAQDCFIGANVLIQKNTKEGYVYQQKSSTPVKGINSLRLFGVNDEVD
jgi:sugar O-acyltransferase (sialic acid O-acetyltransferase NeuD family)